MQVGALAGKYGARKVMIVYGGGSVLRSGLLDRVKQSLQKAGIRYCEMGGVQPNPVDTKVYEGIEICRREQADLLLPVGGGSVIDTAKAIAAGVPYEGDFWDFFIGKAKVTEALKVAVVLTIPAAGSEGSGNSVITKVDTLQKLSLRVPELLRPVFSIMNPELTYTLPPFQTACGIADMMVHIMERYFTNTQDVEISDCLCEGTLTAIIKEAYRIKQNPGDYGARANIMWCGTIAHNGASGGSRPPAPPQSGRRQRSRSSGRRSSPGPARRGRRRCSPPRSPGRCPAGWPGCAPPACPAAPPRPGPPRRWPRWSWTPSGAGSGSPSPPASPWRRAPLGRPAPNRCG